MRPTSALALLVALTLPAGCASLPAPQPLTYLDERTGITLTDRRCAAGARARATRPRGERPRLPDPGGRDAQRVGARDAGAAGASLVDDRHAGDAGGRAGRRSAAGHRRRWARHPAVDTGSRCRGSSSLPRPTTSGARKSAWSTPPSTGLTPRRCAYIAQSERISAFRDVPDDALPFVMWRDGRAALGRLADAAN